MKCKSRGKVNREQPIITEENDAYIYATIQDTSQAQDNTMIVTEGNTAYGMVNTSQDNAVEEPIVTEGNTAYGIVNTSQDDAMEEPIVTEGNTAYGMVNTSQDNAMEEPIVTEGNTAYGMVQNTSQTQDNTMEEPIVTEENTAYEMADQPVVSFDQQQQQNNEQSAVGETFYEAIPDEATEESMYNYPNFCSDEDDPPQPPADKLPSVQQANVTIPEDPDCI